MRFVLLALCALFGARTAEAQQAPGTLTPIAGLSIQSDLAYPYGQGPSWNGVEPKAVTVDVTVTNDKGAVRNDKRALYLANLGEKLGFVFEYADGAACAFDTEGAPTGPIAPGQTVAMRLVKSRLHTRQNFPKEEVVFSNSVEAAINAPGWKDLVSGAPATLTPGYPCGLGMFAAGRWGGELSITAAANGDLTLQGHVDQLGREDAVKQSVAFGPVALPNLTLPKDPRVLLAEQSAAGLLGDGVLPIMDPSPMAQPSIHARRIVVSMGTIDDIGFIMAINGKDAALLSLAEWTAPQNFGFGTVDLGTRLNPGKNIVVLGLHNKAFAYGVGKWAYDFSVTADGALVWRGSKLLRASGVGLRFWKAFLVDKKVDGSMMMRALTDAEGARLEAMMQSINENLVQNFGVEQSSQALFTGAVSTMFFGALTGGGGGGSSYGGAASRPSGDDDALRRLNEQYAKDQAQRDQQAAAADAQWQRLQQPNALGW